MMYKFVLLILISCFSFSLQAREEKIDPNGVYIMTPFGPSKIVTPKDIKERKKREFKEKYGREDNTAGVEFKTRAIREKKDDKEVLSVFIRGCGKIELQALTDKEKEQKTLDNIKNGEYLKVKMIQGKKCQVGSWDKIFK